MKFKPGNMREPWHCNHGRAHQQEEQHNHRIKQYKESPYYHKHDHK